MATYIALLRAVNVGGTGKLPMDVLVQLCERAGFTSVQTYVQSGNVVFRSKKSSSAVRELLERAVSAKVGKPTVVIVRTVDELSQALALNPFPHVQPNRLIVTFYDVEPAAAEFLSPKGKSGEQLVLRGRELFVHYPSGQGASKLKIPRADVSTGRNLNTVAKLVAIAGGLEQS